MGTDFSSVNWAPAVSGGAGAAASNNFAVTTEAIAAGSVQVLLQKDDGTDTDPTVGFFMIGCGDQA